MVSPRSTKLSEFERWGCARGASGYAGGVPVTADPLNVITETTAALSPVDHGGVVRGTTVGRLHVAVPKLRRLVSRGYAFIPDAPTERLAVWDDVWRHGAWSEVMSQALYAYQFSELRRPLTRHEARTVIRWMDRCECWWHGDDLAKIYATIVEDHPRWILPTLRRWNRSANRWRRRNSMVSLIEYASKRLRVLPYAELIGFVEPLLDDDEFYVAKGLGWTLREIGNVYPTEVAGFLERHAHRLQPQAWTGATKNLPRAARTTLMERRRARRDAP